MRHINSIAETFSRSQAFANSTTPGWYKAQGEPRTQTGLNKGLMVMLDAHSNLWSSSSVDSDFQGFTGLIDRTGANVINNLRSQVTAFAK